jgi:hypothetical protein
MADGNYTARSILRHAAESAEGYFGTKVTEDELRDGLEACLRHGWLGIVDKAFMAEIETLLRDQPTLMPVTGSLGLCDYIDFTPTGADLYRTLSGAWLGPTWEDEFVAWKEIYREEHVYCEVEEGLQDVVKEYTEMGQVVLSSRIAAIGPWCVRWWRRFPSGYRLELEIEPAS